MHKYNFSWTVELKTSNIDLWVDGYDLGLCLTVSSFIATTLPSNCAHISPWLLVFSNIFWQINVSGKCDAFIISVFIELLSEVLVALQQICIMYFPLLQSSFFSQVNLISTCQILKQYLLVPSSVSFKMHNCFFPPSPALCLLNWLRF